jgi:DNA-binding MarR family transcriptional regulator
LDIELPKDRHSKAGAVPAKPPELAQVLTQELMDLGKAIDLVGNATAGRLGINQTDLICLDLLLRNGPMTAGHVASALGLTTAAISAMATRLEAGGYARREMDPTDRRRVLLHASPAGAEKAYRMFDGLYQATSELFGRYQQQELELLARLLGDFRELLAAYTATIHGEPPPES